MRLRHLRWFRGTTRASLFILGGWFGFLPSLIETSRAEELLRSPLFEFSSSDSDSDADSDLSLDSDLGFDTKGKTPLMKAASLGDTQLISQLLKAGSKVNERDLLGSTALNYADKFHQRAAFNLLLNSGAYLQLDTLSESAKNWHFEHKHPGEIRDAKRIAAEQGFKTQGFKTGKFRDRFGRSRAIRKLETKSRSGIYYDTGSDPDSD